LTSTIFCQFGFLKCNADVERSFTLKHNMSCGRLENEPTKRWLERLVGQGASDEQLGAVRDLLALEGTQLMPNERKTEY
jgi:hypothetical protein